MKAEAEKTIRKTKGKAIGKKSVTLNNQEYTPDEISIRIKANEIFNLRREFDIDGTPEDDWYQAEKLLRD